MMNLQGLASFVAIVDEGSFRKAAEDRLFITQSTLSRRIQRLEEDLEVRLFDRSKREATLTSVGEVLESEARHLLQRAERLRETVQSAAEGTTGTLRVGFVGSVAYRLLPNVLRRLRNEGLDLRLNLQEMTSARQVEALHEGEIDVGFVRMPIPLHGLETRTVLREPFVAALPSDHPAARQTALDVAVLRDESFVLFPRALGPGLFDAITGICHRVGFSPRVVQEAVLMQTIASLVAGGVGVAIMPSAIAALGLDDVVSVPLRDVDVTSDLAAVWVEGRTSPALERFQSTWPSLEVGDSGPLKT